MALGTPYTIVSGAQDDGVSTTIQVTVEATSVAGDALAVAAASDALGETVTNVTDSQGNLYVLAGADYHQKTGIAAWVALNTIPLVNGVDWVKATFSGGVGAHTLNGRGCSGIAITGAVDQVVTGDDTDSTAIASGPTGSLALPTEWAVAFAASGNAGGMPSGWTGGFTARDTVHQSTHQYQTAADRTTASTAPVSAGATILHTHWAIVLVTLRAATVPAPALQAPVRSAHPAPQPRAGRVAANPGAAVHNPVPAPGPPFYPYRTPARARITPPPRGRATGNAGAPPALLLTNSFEGGTNGTTVTNANSGGVSGNAFGSAPGPPAGGTLAYDNTQAAHGSLSAKFATAATAGAVAVKWTQNRTGNNGIGLAAKLWFRLYAFFPAVPTTATQVFRTFGGDTGAGGGAATASQVFITTGGLVQFQGGTGTAVLTSVTQIPLNSWFRIEGFTSSAGNTGQVSFSLYWPLDSQTPVESQTSSAAVANVRGPAVEADFGHANSTANIGPFWLDDIGVSTTGPLGPVSLEGPPSRGQPESPVAAQIPRSPRQHGRTATSTPGAAPVRNPTVGPVIAAAARPARTRVVLPRAGRCAFSAGAPVSNPVPPPPPQPSGPPVYPLRGPVRAPIPQVFRRGRAARRAGAPVYLVFASTLFTGVPQQASPGGFVPARPPPAAGPPPPPPPPSTAGDLFLLFPP